MMDPKNFAEMVNVFHKVGLMISDNETKIVVSVYDYAEGHVLIHELVIDEYDAVDIFGSYTVYDVRIEKNRLAFTLNIPRDSDKLEGSKDE